MDFLIAIFIVFCIVVVLPLFGLSFALLIDSYKKNKVGFVTVTLLLFVIILLATAGMLGYALIFAVLFFITAQTFKDVKVLFKGADPILIYTGVIAAIALLVTYLCTL